MRLVFPSMFINLTEKAVVNHCPISARQNVEACIRPATSRVPSRKIATAVKHHMQCIVRPQGEKKKIHEMGESGLMERGEELIGKRWLMREEREERGKRRDRDREGGDQGKNVGKE